MRHKTTPHFPQVFQVRPVDKAVDNVDKLSYLNVTKDYEINYVNLVGKVNDFLAASRRGQFVTNPGIKFSAS